MRTWDHWHANHRGWQPIDIDDYEGIGGLRTALSLHAEEAFEEAGDESAQTVVERMFKALTDTFADPRGNTASDVSRRARVSLRRRRGGGSSASSTSSGARADRF